MKTLPTRLFASSLRWKILGWFFVNLAVVSLALLGFLRVQLGLGIDSLLAGPTGDRLEAIARPLSGELRRLPVSDWTEALARAVGPYQQNGDRVRAAIVANDGILLAGDLPTMPPEVLRVVARPPGGSSARPPPPPPDEQPPRRMRKFMLGTTSPRFYWAGVFLGDVSPSGSSANGPDTHRRVAALVLASPSLRGGGLFFDYAPWLALGGGLALLSVLLWLPFVGRLTRGLTEMTRTAEQIAEGRFQPSSNQHRRRRDELGRLARALEDMAARLEGFVTGQKRFLGDTAHELLSPLGRLEVSLAILEQRAAAPADRELAERALGEVHHLAGLVRNLLLFTKSELRGTPVVLRRIPLLELAHHAVAREAAGHEVRVNIAPDLCALADADLLGRALGNVVRNAVRYAGSAGPITLSAGLAPDSPDTEVLLTVADHGPGAPAEALHRLFDPFFRPEAARNRETGGTGLGLAIVKSCVEACGGQVTARNRTAAGLALVFRLRRA